MHQTKSIALHKINIMFIIYFSKMKYLTRLTLKYASSNDATIINSIIIITLKIIAAISSFLFDTVR